MSSPWTGDRKATCGSFFPLFGGAPITPTKAPFPVWRGSTAKEVRFAPMPKKQAVKLYCKAERFDRQTRPPGCQDGAIGQAGLRALRALLFEFLNYASGAALPVLCRDCLGGRHERVEGLARPRRAQGGRRHQLAAPVPD